MVETAMIENHVHHHLQSLSMSLIHETLILVIGAEARVHAVIVCSGVAMVRRVGAIAGAVVLQNGRKPQRRHAKVCEVVEVLAYSLKVAAMTQTRSRAVTGLVAHCLEGVVLGIAVGEAVGHEHVKHILIGESHALVARHSAVFQFVPHLLSLLALLEAERHLARLRALKVEIEEEIVGRVETCDRVDAHSGIVDLHVRVTHVLAVNHQLERRVLHAYIPVGGFDAVHLYCCIQAHSTHKHY